MYASTAGRRQKPAAAGTVSARAFQYCPHCGYELTPGRYWRKLKREDLRIALWIALPLVVAYALWILITWGIVQFR